MSTEEWRPVVGYEGVYEVSTLGRVRSLDRIDRLGRRLRGLVLKQRADRDGYLKIHAGGRPRRILSVHRLVLLAFVGPPPDGTEALHADGDPANNKLSNLRWGTRSENRMDSVRHGTHKNTAKTHCPSGHAYDGDNTYFYPRSNNRMCRECARRHSRAQFKKQQNRKKAGVAS